MRVAEIRHAPNGARFLGQESRGQDRQGRVFRSADFNRTAQRPPTVNADFIHTWLIKIE